MSQHQNSASSALWRSVSFSLQLALVLFAVISQAGVALSKDQPKASESGNFIQGLMPFQVFPRQGKTGAISFTYKDSEALTAVVRKQADNAEIAQQRWDAEASAVVRKLSIKNIPVGGEYSVEFVSGDRKKIVDHLLVGELWIIGGQSNACGTEFDPPDPEHPMVHFLRGDHWEVARDALFPCFSTKNFVGPCRRAAERYYEQTGIPIGMLGWAFGGVPMSRFWNQNNYEELIDLQGIVTEHGKGASTFLWYQGESDSGPDSVPLYQKRLTKMIERLRHYSGNPDMLAGVVQLSYSLSPQNFDKPYMGLLRETQRATVAADPRALLFPALPYSHFDTIHLDHTGYLALGTRIAEALTEVHYTGKIRWQGPRVVEAKFSDESRRLIAIRFDSPDGLRVLPHPVGVEGEWAQRGPEKDWFIQDETHQGYPEVVKAEIRDGKLVVETKGGVPINDRPQIITDSPSAGAISHSKATLSFEKTGYLQPISVRQEGLTIYLELSEPAGQGALVSYALLEASFCTLTDEKGLPAATFAELPIKSR